MGYLKLDSVPAMQEIRMREACQIIARRCRERAAADKKSYVISCKGFGEASPDLPFFSSQTFGRG